MGEHSTLLKAVVRRSALSAYSVRVLRFVPAGRRRVAYALFVVFPCVLPYARLPPPPRPVLGLG